MARMLIFIVFFSATSPSLWAANAPPSKKASSCKAASSRKKSSKKKRPSNYMFKSEVRQVWTDLMSSFDLPPANSRREDHEIWAQKWNKWAAIASSQMSQPGIFDTPTLKATADHLAKYGPQTTPSSSGKNPDREGAAFPEDNFFPYWVASMPNFFISYLSKDLRGEFQYQYVTDIRDLVRAFIDDEEGQLLLVSMAVEGLRKTFVEMEMAGESYDNKVQSRLTENLHITFIDEFGNGRDQFFRNTQYGDIENFSSTDPLPAASFISTSEAALEQASNSEYLQEFVSESMDPDMRLPVNVEPEPELEYHGGDKPYRNPADRVRRQALKAAESRNTKKQHNTLWEIFDDSHRIENTAQKRRLRAAANKRWEALVLKEREEAEKARKWLAENPNPEDDQDVVQNQAETAPSSNIEDSPQPGFSANISSSPPH